MALLDRLKVRLGISGNEEDLLLDEMLLGATEIFIELRYPVTPCPLDENGTPIIDTRWDGWIVSAAVEMYGRIGIEGQNSHSENGISRGYDSSDLSASLCQKVTPIAGIVS